MDQRPLHEKGAGYHLQGQAESRDVTPLIPGRRHATLLTYKVLPSIANQKTKEKIMLKITTISALVLSIAVISAQSPAQAKINPEAFGNFQSANDADFKNTDISHQLFQNAASSSNADPVQVAWSIKGAYKKAKKGVKKVGRTTGRVVRKANRIIVPSEIRHGASFAYRKAKKGAKYAARHPYGKRCKPNKYLQPVCTVKGKGRANVHDHRN